MSSDFLSCNISGMLTLSFHASILSPSRKGCMSIFPYFCPPPVPLTCVCVNPFTISGISAHPAFGIVTQSGPGLTIPYGMDGPMKTRPSPTEPIRGSTHFVWSAETGRDISDNANMRWRDGFMLIVLRWVRFL